jgi:Protein of unknown function (DUF2934)
MAKKKTQAAKPAKRSTKKSTTAAAKPTTAKKTTRKTVAAAPVSPVEPKIVVNHDSIARQAYLIWLERGGSAESNWLQAEQRLQAVAAQTRV